MCDFAIISHIMADCALAQEFMNLLPVPLAGFGCLWVAFGLLVGRHLGLAGWEFAGHFDEPWTSSFEQIGLQSAACAQFLKTGRPNVSNSS